MQTHSPRSSAPTALRSDWPASALSRLTGICLAPVSTRPTKKTLNRLSLIRNRGTRPQSHTNRAKTSGSAYEMWLVAMITPPSGTRSRLRQRTLKTIPTTGRMMNTQSQIQNPTWPRRERDTPTTSSRARAGRAPVPPAG